MKFRAYLLISVAFFAAGCVSYRGKSLSASVSAQALERRSLSDSGLQKALGHKVSGHSWNLGSLTRAALYFQPDLQVARAKLAQAEAAIETGGARPNPTLSWSPTFNADTAAGISPWTLGFSLDVPIETAGKRGHRIAQAQELANAARLNVASAAWRIRSATRKALLDIHAAALTQDALQRQQSVQAQNVEMLEQRFKAGDISTPQVSLARVAASQVALHLRDAEKLAGEARARLATAIGVPALALAKTDISFHEFERVPEISVRSLRRAALLHRSGVLAALAEYRAAEAALRLEIAKQFPDLHLNPGYAWDQGEDKYTFGFSLTLPVLNQNRGPIREAEAKRKTAEASVTAVQAKVIGEIDQALASYRGARRKLDTADALLHQQRQQQQSVEASFKAGASDRLELLQAQLELFSGELSRAGALIEAQAALGQLEEVLQHPIGTRGDSERIVRLINQSAQ